MELSITDTSPPVEKPVEQPKSVGPYNGICETCQRPIETDGFCSWHGPLFDRWLCDDCVASYRSSGSQPIAPYLYKLQMDENKVREQLNAVQFALRNMGQIKWIEGNDASGAQRNVDLNLTFRESRPIYQAILDVLKTKLEDATSFPA